MKRVTETECKDINNCILEANQYIKKLNWNIKMVQKVDTIRAATIKKEKTEVDKKISWKSRWDDTNMISSKLY